MSHGKVFLEHSQPHETRWPALQKAVIDDLFSVALLSCPLGARKPDPLFSRLVLAAAEAPPEQVLFVGDNLACDVAGPSPTACAQLSSTHTVCD